MDDYLIPTLNDSRNEWCERLICILVPHINEGIRSIFNEAMKMCIENNETVKYLMTFQNLLSKIPKWNSVIVQDEVNRIIQKSGCNYINDLITCVHIIQLKVLTCIRVGNKQKKIDISIPKLDHFIHSVYIHVARKLYSNIYLFESNSTISPLQKQKNNREIELMISECILTTIRESIPTEQIVRAYLDESIEHEEEIIIENMEEPVLSSGGSNDNIIDVNNINNRNLEEQPPAVATISNIDDNSEPTITRTTLKFNDNDYMIDQIGNKTIQNVSKSIDNLEDISLSNSIKRKLEEEDEESDDDNERLRIHEDNIDLGDLDIFDINKLDAKDSENINLNKLNSEPPTIQFEELY